MLCYNYVMLVKTMITDKDAALLKYVESDKFQDSFKQLQIAGNRLSESTRKISVLLREKGVVDIDAAFAKIK